MFWRRFLRVPWTARRSTQAILKKISPEYSLEGLMLKLKLQYFGHLMRRTDSLERAWCWERLKVGGEGDDRGWDGWMASPTGWTWGWASSGCRWWTRKPSVLQYPMLQRVRHDWATDLNLCWQSNIPAFQGSVPATPCVQSNEKGVMQSFGFLKSTEIFLCSILFHHPLQPWPLLQLTPSLVLLAGKWVTFIS